MARFCWRNLGKVWMVLYLVTEAVAQDQTTALRDLIDPIDQIKSAFCNATEKFRGKLVQFLHCFETPPEGIKPYIVSTTS